MDEKRRFAWKGALLDLARASRAILERGKPSLLDTIGPERDTRQVPQNVEAIRRGYEAWNGGDVDGVLRDLDPEIEWRPRLGAAGVRATLYRGHEGVLAYKREVEEALGALEVDVLSIEELGDHVLAHIHARGQGSASGVPVDAEGFHLWTMRAGRAVGFETYSTKREALEAAGLSE